MEEEETAAGMQFMREELKKKWGKRNTYAIPGQMQHGIDTVEICEAVPQRNKTVSTM